MRDEAVLRGLLGSVYLTPVEKAALGRLLSRHLAALAWEERRLMQAELSDGGGGGKERVLRLAHVRARMAALQEKGESEARELRRDMQEPAAIGEVDPVAERLAMMAEVERKAGIR